MYHAPALLAYGRILGHPPLASVISEAYLIIWLRRPLTPLPVRLLNGVTTLVASGERRAQQTFDRTAPKGVGEYACFALVFGP